MRATFPDIEVIAIALEDEYAAIFGTRCSTRDARRLAFRAAQAIQDSARPKFRKDLAAWINGNVTYSEWSADPSRPGVFRDHNCARCQSGAKPCVKGNPRQCENLHARND